METVESLSRDSRLWLEQLENAVSVAANYTIRDQDDIILVDSTSGIVTVSLPRAINGRKISVVRIAGSNNVVLSPAGTDTIDGTSSLAIAVSWVVVHLKAIRGAWIASICGVALDGDKGDITVSGSGATWTIDNDVVTYAKMQNVSATSRIIGRKTSGAGDPEECTLSEILDFIGSAAQGDILYRGASSWATLKAGIDGYYLRTKGAGQNPDWESALFPNQGTVGLGVLKWGGLNVPQNATRYLGSLGVAPNATYSNANIYVTRPVTISNLYVHLNAAVAASQSVVVTVAKNNSGTAVTCTINAGATTGSDTNNTVTFDEGDSLNIKVVTSATFGATTEIKATVVCTDTYGSYGVTPLRFGANAGAAGAASYSELAVNASVATEANIEVPLPACRVKTYPFIDSGTGAFGLNAKWRRNATSTIGTFYGGEGVLHPAYAENDLMNCRDTATLVASITPIAEIQAVDATQYPPCLSLFSSIGQVQNVTRYMTGYGVAAGTATESEVSIPMPACTVKNLRVAASSAPAAGQTIVVTVRKNGVATALTTTVADTGRVFADTSNSVSFAAGDLLSIESVTSATSGTRSVNACIEFVP